MEETGKILEREKADIGKEELIIYMSNMHLWNFDCIILKKSKRTGRKNIFFICSGRGNYGKACHIGKRIPEGGRRYEAGYSVFPYRGADVVKSWIRDRTTLEFWGTWEQIYSPVFKAVEFDHFKNEAGLHTFALSVSEWIEKTEAIGLFESCFRVENMKTFKEGVYPFR